MESFDENECLYFVKIVSLFKSFDVSLRESKDGQITLSKLQDMQSAMKKMFYVYLDEAF